MKYNFKQNLKRHESVQRVYALQDEAALMICDYGRGQRPKIPFPYHAEAWTGLEYAVAALMMFQGLKAEGLKIVEAVRRRHDGERRNPWNEPECGHHYARALSAWGPILALSGFLHDAPRQAVAAKPLWNPGSFECFWASGSGWGVFNQAVKEGRQRFTLAVHKGSLAMKTLGLLNLATGESAASARLGNRRLAVQATRKGNEVTLAFAEPVLIEQGAQLVVTL